MEIIGENQIGLFKKIAVLLFFIMFIYSGINKITKFTQKTLILKQKIGVPYFIAVFGMVMVIILEIVGSLIIYYNLFNKSKIRQLTHITYLLFLLFLIVVTLIYHPPTDKIIPFLSNVTTFGGLLYLYVDFLKI